MVVPASLEGPEATKASLEVTKAKRSPLIRRNADIYKVKYILHSENGKDDQGDKTNLAGVGRKEHST